MQDEVSQQYMYIERLESLLGSMPRQHCSNQVRADLQLLHLSKPLPGEGQRVAALKARCATAARCQQGLQVSLYCPALPDYLLSTDEPMLQYSKQLFQHPLHTAVRFCSNVQADPLCVRSGSR